MPRTKKEQTTPPPDSVQGVQDGKNKRDKADWERMRREYVAGTDEVTYDSLCAKYGTVRPDTLRKRASREKWTELRADFRHKDAAKARQLDLETVEEVRKRHTGIGKHLQGMGMKRVQQLLADPEEFAKLTVYEALAAIRYGVDIERKGRGMEEFTVNVQHLQSPADLEDLSDDQLLELLERKRGASASAKA